jgi:hypothetical protein
MPIGRQYTAILTRRKGPYRRKNKVLGIFYENLRKFSRKCQVVWRQIAYLPAMCQPGKEVQASSTNTLQEHQRLLCVTRRTAYLAAHGADAQHGHAAAVLRREKP